MGQVADWAPQASGRLTVSDVDAGEARCANPAKLG